MRTVMALLLIVSLTGNVVLAGVVGIGIVTNETFSGIARKAAKYFRLPPIGGRWTANRDYQSVQPCRLNESVVVLVLGQSNGANAAFSYRRAADADARAFWSGSCYGLSDPIIGGDGQRGSQWPMFADLFKASLGRSVTIVSAGWGGTQIEDWSRRGYDRAALAQIGALAALGRKVDAVFWQQGESDYATDPATYRERFGVVMNRLREAGVTAPVFVAQSTLSADHRNEPLRSLQAELGRQPGFAPGPDADTVTERFDGYHFTAEGTDKMAKLWVDAVTACNCLARD